jgi:glycosyltransferase involved in cell wall biosynthesis
MRQKRVMLFIDSLESGGAQRQIVVLANVLHDLDYHVDILTYYPGDQLSQFLKSPEIARHHLPRRSRYDIGFFFRLRRFFVRERPDCIISYLTTTNFWARTAGRLAGVPRIITSERSNSLAQRPAIALRERLLSKLSDVIVVNSYNGQRNLATLGMPAKKLVVIYNGLDCENFSRKAPADIQQLRQSLGVEQNEFLIVLPGRMSPEKNHLLLISAAQRLDLLRQRIKIAFAGNEFYPETKQAIVTQIAKSGTKDRFLLLGPRTDMPLLYSAADVVVLPSIWEGFPNALVEAMSCSTPVIASNISDNSRIIDDPNVGILFESNNDVQLADAIQTILNLTPDERRSMGTRGAERARELCSLQAFGEKYRALIDDAPSQSTQTPCAE